MGFAYRSWQERTTKTSNKRLSQKNTKNVCFDKYCFFSEIASTPESRTRGLMFRKQLNQDSAMLFIFEKEDYYGVWMKNTYIPLDIVWLNEEKEIVYIYQNAQPCALNDCKITYPEKKAKYVLEINAGLVKKFNLTPGDIATISVGVLK